MIRFKKTIFSVIALAGLITGISPVYAADTSVFGQVVSAFGNPSGTNGDYFTIQLNTNGPCGTSLFYVNRTQSNYKDIVAITLTAYAMGKQMWLNVTGCDTANNTINIINNAGF
jgi:hypothetical protein